MANDNSITDQLGTVFAYILFGLYMALIYPFKLLFEKIKEISKKG